MSLILKLVIAASSLAPRSILHSCSTELVAAVRKDSSGCSVDGGWGRKQGNAWSVSSLSPPGGSLLLGRGGVSIIGNLSTTKREVKESLQQGPPFFRSFSSSFLSLLPHSTLGLLHHPSLSLSPSSSTPHLLLCTFLTLNCR